MASVEKFEEIESIPKIFPIGGGKGGVGKSFVTASLGVLMARHGLTLALVDLDLGASNLHTFLGMPVPKDGLNLFLNKAAVTLDSVAVATPVTNLFLISSATCPMEIANLHYAQKIKLIKAIKKLPFDYVLIDLGAGSHFNTLDFFLTSNKGIFVCTPEPTSIENTFRFIKAVYFRKIKRLAKRQNFSPRAKAAILETESSVLTSKDILEIAAKYDPDQESSFKARIGQFQFKLILNQFRKTADADLGNKIEAVCNRHFYSPFEFLGGVSFDERVIDSVYGRRLYVKNYPSAITTMELKQIAGTLTNFQPAPALVQQAL